MNHPIVTILFNVKRKGSKYIEAPKLLEEVYFQIKQELQTYQLEKAEILKQYCIDTFLEVEEEEKEIEDRCNKAYQNENDIAKRKPFDDVEFNYWYKEREYYNSVLGPIHDCKSVLIEFLASYYPKGFAINDELLEKVKTILPAWNKARKKVLALSKVKKLNKEMSKKGGKASKRLPDNDTIQKVISLMKKKPIKEITEGTLFRLVTKEKLTNSKGMPISKSWLNKHLEKFKESN